MINKLEQYIEAASMVPGSVIIFQLQDDDTMKVFFYSKKAQQQTGMNLSEVDHTVKPDGFNMIIKDDQAIILEMIKKAITNNDDFDVVYRQRHKTKGIVWVHMNASIIGSIDDKPVFLATMLDVTNEMLSSSAIMEASSNAICVIEKETKLLLYGNSRFYKLIDQEPSDSLGIYCYDALCGNPAFKHNNDCLCFSTIDIDPPFEYYNSVTKQYLSMYGRSIMWGEHEAYVFFLTDQTEEKFKEKQLKNARQRFEMTLDNSDLFIWEYDMVNNQCINSKKAVRDYGIPMIIDNYPESLYDMGHTPPETVEQIKAVKQRLLNGETGFSVERRTIDANGESQWMKVSYTLEKDASGRPVRALVCGSDITEQKKKESLYEEEIRLRKSVTGDSEALCILNLTQDCIKDTDVLSPLLRDVLIDGTIDDNMRIVCNQFVVPIDRESYVDHFKRESMMDNYERGIMHDSFCHQFIHRGGWYESTYDLIVNPSTSDVEVILSLKNVTDEIRSKQVVNKLTSIDYDSIATIDLETKEIYRFERGTNSGVSSGKIIDGAAYENFQTAAIHAYCAPEDVARIIHENNQDVVLKALETQPVYTMMYTMKKDGKRERKRNIYTYIDESRKTLLFASQNITEAYLLEEKQKQELMQAKEKAEVANRAKTAFLSRVSHDMRTPLNGVLGLTTLMKDEACNAQMVADLKQLEMSGQYLLNLINDVLDVSSIESGKMELHPTVCDSQNLLNNIIKLIKPNMDAKHINLELHADQLTLMPTVVDEARIQQMAMNVLGNAAKFTPEGGKVEFIAKTLSISHGIIVNEFIIRDNGIGMDAAFLPHLFEPFSQENASSTNSKTGTGLGMSITKQIVKLMNGTIDVKSQKGEGTEFRAILEFPIATDEQITQDAHSAKPSVSNFNLDGKRILLCEDHPLNMKIAKRLLNKVGVTVDHAENGQIGVDLFNKAPAYYYDAILMDIRMPMMDGLDATRMIRKLDKQDAKTIPILAMTANALTDDVKNTIEAGMNAHLSKPINPTQLYQNLEKYITANKTINRVKVLIVDDIEMNRAILVAPLQKEYEVFEANNGEEALALLKRYPSIGVVVTDLQMPQMDGIALIKTIRATEEYKHIAIIAYTQFEEKDQEQKLLEMGVDDFIYKPTNPKIVELRVKKAIRHI